MTTSVIHTNPEILGGTPVFQGTRVPIQNLFDYLEGGETLDEFLDDFPSVTREQAVEILKDCDDLQVAKLVHGKNLSLSQYLKLRNTRGY